MSRLRGARHLDVGHRSWETHRKEERQELMAGPLEPRARGGEYAKRSKDPSVFDASPRRVEH
jgi:hypothetical protein